MTIYNDNPLPTTPDPTYLSIAAGLVRGVLQIASGLGFAWAAGVTGDQVMMVASALVMVATLTWSTWQKIQAARTRRAAANQSANQSANATFQAGERVTVAVVNPK
jgi:threonine/homoserine/homoserine lactone efflux protein